MVPSKSFSLELQTNYWIFLEYIHQSIPRRKTKQTKIKQFQPFLKVQFPYDSRVHLSLSKMISHGPTDSRHKIKGWKSFSSLPHIGGFKCNFPKSKQHRNYSADIKLQLSRPHMFRNNSVGGNEGNERIFFLWRKTGLRNTDPT